MEDTKAANKGLPRRRYAKGSAKENLNVDSSQTDTDKSNLRGIEYNPDEGEAEILRICKEEGRVIISGTSGSGKTTLGQKLQKLGITVVNMDEYGHRVQDSAGKEHWSIKPEVPRDAQVYVGNFHNVEEVKKWLKPTDIFWLWPEAELFRLASLKKYEEKKDSESMPPDWIAFWKRSSEMSDSDVSNFQLNQYNEFADEIAMPVNVIYVAKTGEVEKGWVESKDAVEASS